jgi:hypothetical protein
MIAGEFGWIAVTLVGPHRNQLASGLADCAKRNEVSGYRESGFLVEFTLRGSQRVFGVGVLTLWDRPGTKIFF